MRHVLVKEKVNRCSYYFALEEYLLKKQSQEEYFFIWQIEQSLVVGRNQAIFEEIQVEKAKQDQVQIYRRPSGGGAVYADENCLMFSFITPHFDTKMVFRTYLNKMVGAFIKMGIPCSFSGRNDLLIAGKKFSGNAFYRRLNHACLHGTLLFATDFLKMSRYLTPSSLKLESKGVQSVAMRVDNLSSYYQGSKEEFYQQLLFYLEVDSFCLNPEEEIHVRQLQKKYESEEWIYRKTAYNKKIQTYTPAGIIDLHFLIHDKRIQSLTMSGDFFEHSDLAPVEQAFQGQLFDPSTILLIFKQQKIEDYIYDLKRDEWLKQVEQGLYANPNLAGS